MESDRIIKDYLSQLKSEDIFTPISMIKLIDVEDTTEEILEMIAQYPHSHYPVYKDGVDNILGILNVADIAGAADFKLNEIVRQPMFISENKNALELLSDFKQKNQSFAIVVDEHGAVRGVVTKSNILDALWEDGEPEINELVIKQGSEYLVDPVLSLDDFNKKFDTDLVCEDCDSIGGYVIEKFTYVPSLGEFIQEGNMTITVSKTEGAKLLELTVKINR